MSKVKLIEEVTKEFDIVYKRYEVDNPDKFDAGMLTAYEKCLELIQGILP